MSWYLVLVCIKFALTNAFIDDTPNNPNIDLSNSLLAMIEVYIGPIEEPMQYRNSLVDQLEAIFVSATTNSTTSELLTDLAHVSWILDRYTESLRNTKSDDDIRLRSYMVILAPALADLVGMELETVWSLLHGNIQRFTAHVLKYIQHAHTLVVSSFLASKGLSTSNQMRYERSSSIEPNRMSGLPLSLFDRGSKVLLVEPTFEDLGIWLRQTGWFSEVSFLESRSHWSRSCQSGIVHWDRSMTALTGFNGTVIILAEFIPMFLQLREKTIIRIPTEVDIRELPVNIAKSAVLQQYLRDQDVFYLN